ncbi:hypothetical protein [uncultured Enterovirga sp.]
MTFGINLRGDLARLDDRELSDRLETGFDDRQTTYDNISDLWGRRNKTL